MNEYEKKQERRRERYLARAEKAREESNSRYDMATESIAGIPAGQPVLVGHHSDTTGATNLERTKP